MPNGDTQHDSVWRAIDNLRDQLSDQKTRTAVNESQVLDLKDDINGVGNKVSDSEARVKRYVDNAVGALDKRINSGVLWLKWTAGLAIPVVAGLLGALISRVGGG